MEIEQWKKAFFDWWENDKAMQKAVSVFDICMQGIIQNQTKAGFRAGYEAAQNQYKDKIDKVLNHLNLSPVERHTVDILMKEDIL